MSIRPSMFAVALLFAFPAPPALTEPMESIITRAHTIAIGAGDRPVPRFKKPD